MSEISEAVLTMLLIFIFIGICLGLTIIFREPLIIAFVALCLAIYQYISE